jgi:hypothetical protein
VRTDPSAVPGAETEGRADAFSGTARPSLRDRHLCDKPSRPEAATPAAWSRTVFPYALPTQFQFTLNQDRGRGVVRNRATMRTAKMLGLNTPSAKRFRTSAAL